MAIESNLKSLEKDMFRRSILDGLIDIQIGCVVLIFVFAPLLSPYLGDFWASMVFLPFWAAIFLGIRTLRKKVIQPRIGSIKFGPSRVKKLTRVNSIILIVNLAALVLGILSFKQISSLPPWIHSARLSIILLIGFSLAGYMLEFPRLYLYGIMIASAPVLGEYLFQQFGASHHGFPITFGVTSGIIILIGLVTLIRLLKKYPAPNEDFQG